MKRIHTAYHKGAQNAKHSQLINMVRHAVIVK